MLLASSHLTIWEVITQYKAWHCYATKELQVEVVELEFPQTEAKIVLSYQVVELTLPNFILHGYE